MNIFRSEEDAKSWDRFDPVSTDSIRPVAEYFALFNTEMFARRLDRDYLAKLPTYMGATFGAIAGMGRDPFWELPRLA